MRRAIAAALLCTVALACRDQSPEITVDGSWVNAAGFESMSMTLDQDGTSVTGSASINQPARSFTVTGTFTDGVLDLTLTVPGEAWVFLSTLVFEDEILGELTGPNNFDRLMHLDRP